MSSQQGGRIPYDSLPAEMVRWVEQTVGFRNCLGIPASAGFMPGFVGTILDDRGCPVGFVKSVCSGAFPDSARRLREEIFALEMVRGHILTPSLMGTYDRGGWVALIEHVAFGRHPKLSENLDWNLTNRAFRRLAHQLSSIPFKQSPNSMSATFDRWLDMRSDANSLSLPDGFAATASTWGNRGSALRERMVSETLCHWDPLPDNVFIEGANVTIVDWGSSRSGPKWMDQYMLTMNLAGMECFLDRVYGGRDPLPLRPDELLTLMVLQTISVYWVMQKGRGSDIAGLSEQRQRRIERMLAGIASLQVAFEL